jgi:hypothetical protein
VRALYEKSVEADGDAEEDEREQADAAEPDDDSGTLAPAWAGARAGASVAVPPEFAPVTGLGMPLKVSPHQGLKLLPSFGPPRVTHLVRYRDGLAYQAGSKAVHPLAWEAIASITSNLTFHPEQRNSWTDHEYTLATTNGEKLILDDGLKGVAQEAPAIKQAVYALLRPPALQAYKGGQALTFGPVTAHKTSGLQLEGQAYAWSAIQDVRLEHGRLRLTLTGGQKHETRVSAIPNVELLCQLIGVQLDEDQLAYKAFL